MRTHSYLLTAASAALLLLGVCMPAAKGADILITAPASAFLGAAPAAVSGQVSDRPSRDLSRGDARWKKQWQISLVPLFASESLDAASSYGMRELNPLLAGSNGGFGVKASAMKFGVVGALAGAEYLLVRKYPHSAKFFAIINWTTAGATTALAVHNFDLPR